MEIIFFCYMLSCFIFVKNEVRGYKTVKKKTYFRIVKMFSRILSSRRWMRKRCGTENVSALAPTVFEWLFWFAWLNSEMLALNNHCVPLLINLFTSILSTSIVTNPVSQIIEGSSDVTNFESFFESGVM